jgi:hypothetical protein
MNKYYLVKITFSDGKIRHYIKLNPEDRLRNNQCNPRIFYNPDVAELNIDTLDYFNCKMEIIKKLDRRTREFKTLEKALRYFTVGDLY